MAYKEHKKPQFIEAYKRLGTKFRAAQAVGIHRDTVEEWLKSDLKFAEEFNRADTVVTEDLEDTALEQAKSGNSALLIFLLKCRNPAKYTERFKHEIVSVALTRLVGMVVTLMRRILPDVCPHCRTNLNLKPRVAKELMELSEQLENSNGSTKLEAVE